MYLLVVCLIFVCEHRNGSNNIHTVLTTQYHTKLFVIGFLFLSRVDGERILGETRREVLRTREHTLVCDRIRTVLTTPYHTKLFVIGVEVVEFDETYFLLLKAQSAAVLTGDGDY